VESLKKRGYKAVNIPQEHSVSKKFWRRLNPDFIIYLRCSLDVARERRKIQWGQERLDEQWDILSDARENANLFIDTDDLGREDVLGMAVEQIEEWKRNRA
jgi:thymidylate kinase